MFVRLALVWLAIGVGCNDPMNLPSDQVWTSAHFRYATRADDTGVCPDVVDKLEAHFALVNAYLGIEWPGGTIDYYKYRNATDFVYNSDCPQRSTACANGWAIQSPLALDRHELVHVYTRHLGRPPAMFEEGLAEALAPAGRTFGAPTQSWQEVLGAPPLAGGLPADIAYWGGAWFVAHLLRHHPVPTFIAFYSTARAAADEAEVAATFQQIYGVALDDEWRHAQTEDANEAGVPIWECTADPMALGGAAADLSERCDGSGAFATFDLAQETSLVWYDADLSSGGFNLARCALDSDLHIEGVGWNGALETGALSVPAGHYTVAPFMGFGTLGLGVAANAVAATCADAVPVVLPPAARYLTLAIGNSPDARYVKLRHPDGATVELARSWDSPLVPKVMAASVEVCTDCSGTCAAFDNSVETPLSDGQVLRLGGLNAPSGATAVRFGYR